jgi:hypothetical protein
MRLPAEERPVPLAVQVFPAGDPVIPPGGGAMRFREDGGIPRIDIPMGEGEPAGQSGSNWSRTRAATGSAKLCWKAAKSLSGRRVPAADTTSSGYRGPDDGSHLADHVFHSRAQLRHGGHSRHRHQAGCQRVFHEVLALGFAPEFLEDPPHHDVSRAVPGNALVPNVPGKSAAGYSQKTLERELDLPKTGSTSGAAIC